MISTFFPGAYPRLKVLPNEKYQAQRAKKGNACFPWQTGPYLFGRTTAPIYEATSEIACCKAPSPD